MADKLLIHPDTLYSIESFTMSPSHAILITGVPGSGKEAVAKLLAMRILNIDSLEDYPYFSKLSRPKDKKDIPIENVRLVLGQLSLKTPGRAPIRRLILINDAHHMSAAAQNALLKAIEEPPSDTVFILTTDSERSVLPTIASRTQKLRVQPISLEQSQEFYSDRYSGEEIASAWRLSNGAVGLLDALLLDSVDHRLKNAVNEAKELLMKSPYERLLYLDGLSKDKEEFDVLLDALGRVLNALNRAVVAREGNQSSLLASRRLVLRLRSMLQDNVSPRLIATTLALNLKT